MQRIIPVVSLILMIITSAGAFVEGSSDHSGIIIPSMEETGDNPFLSDGYFIENRGQADEDVLFIYSGSPGLMIHDDGMTVITDDLSYRMVIEDGSHEVASSGIDNGPKFNFYYGDDPFGWIEGARSYSTVMVENVKDGVDLRILSGDTGPKWELLLDEGILARDLMISYRGDIDIEKVDEYHLSIGNGESSIIEGPFVFFQNERDIPGTFDLEDDRISFDLDGMDPFLPLIIDPLLTASTFIGGNSWDQYPEITIHSSGDLIITATTESSNMFTHSTAKDRSFNGAKDLIICRMSNDLSSMSYATYIGGSQYDRVSGSVCDGSGSVHVVGATTSSNFPRTSGALQSSYQGGISDGFYLNISANLGTLQYSTYIGGSGSDNLTGVDIGPDDSVSFCGSSNSNDLPATTGAYQENLKGNSDGFVGRFLNGYTGLDFLSYLGGDGFGDEVNDIAVDDLGRPVVVGYAVSEDFPTTEGSYRNGSGYYQGFVSRFTSDGSDLQMSTFLAYGTVIDSIFLGSDGIYLTGTTVSISGTFPVSEDAYDKDLDGYVDGFITKMAFNGSMILRSTFIGHNEQWGNPPDGDYIEGCTDIVADPSGRPVVTGYTDSTNFPLTQDAFDRSRKNLEAFVLMMDPDLTYLEYSTFLGGHDEEKGTGIALDNSGWLYAVGHTYDDQGTADFPTTEGAYDTEFNSQYDLYAVRFKMDSFLPGPPVSPGSTFFETSINLTWAPPVDDGNEPVLGYNIWRGSSPTSLTRMGQTEELWYNDTGLIKGKTYYYEIRAVNVVGEGPGATASNTPFTVPGAPRIGEPSPGNAHINISWNPPTDKGGTDDLTYIVRYGTSVGSLDLEVSGIERRWYDLTGLTNGVRYYFSVFAQNHMGIGPGSTTGNSTPLGRPTPPLNLSATLGSGAATLRWNDPVDMGGSSSVFYNVYRYVNESYHWVVENGVFENSYRITGMLNGQNYTYFVTASNLLGEGDWSEMITVTPFGIISEPFDLIGVEHGDWVQLKWNPPNRTGDAWTVKYQVFMGIEKENMSNVETTTSTNISIHDLTPGEVYHFMVTASNPVYNSTSSNILTLRPMKVPSQPRDLEFERGDGFIDLNWKESEDFGGALSVYYTVHYGDSPSSIVPMNTTTETGFNLTGLENGKRYYVSITATNVKGTGPFSQFINTTPMSVPSIPRHVIYSEGDGTIELSWESPFDFGGSNMVTYNIYMGTNSSDLSLISREMIEKELFIDDLENGRVYMIMVKAVNIMGESKGAILENVVPMTDPGSPSIVNISVSVEPPGLIIWWEPPVDDGGSDVWYYYIYRMDAEGNLVEIGNVGGHVRNFLDENVERGLTYTYSIRAVTSYGESPLSEKYEMEFPEEEEETLTEESLLLIMVGLVILIIVILIVLAVVSRARKNSRLRKMWEE